MKLTIKRMLTILIGTFVVLLVATMVFSSKVTNDIMASLEMQQDVSEQYKLLSEMRPGTTELVLAAMDSIIDQAEMRVSDERMEVINESINVLMTNTEHLQGTFVSEEEKKLFAEIKDSIPGIAQAVAVDLPRSIERGLTEASTAAIDDAIDGSGDVLDGNLRRLQELSFARMEEITKATEENVFSSNMLLEIVLAVGLLINVSLGIYTYRFVNGSLSGLSRCMRELAKGNYDIEIYGSDRIGEIGAMSAAVSVFKENALAKQEMEEKEKAEQAARQERASRIESSVKEFENTVSGIIQSVSAAASQLSQSSESMGSVIGTVSQKAENVSRSSGETSQNVQSVASATEEMSASVQEISQQISLSTDAVSTAVSEMQKADETSKSLDEATQKIGDIVNLIEDIAEQINLLALNATIESARAGEAGKGFAVVASEVKNLASQTTKATGDIGESIANIRGVSDQVIQALNSIKGAIDNVNEISSAISAAVEEQSAVTNEIASNMTTASTGTSQINEDILDVTQASEEARASANQNLDAARTLSEQAEILNREVNGFLEEISAA